MTFVQVNGGVGDAGVGFHQRSSCGDARRRACERMGEAVVTVVQVDGGVADVVVSVYQRRSGGNAGRGALSKK